jgi:hypothetical protein
VALPPQDDRLVASDGITCERCPPRDMALSVNAEAGLELLDWCQEQGQPSLVGCRTSQWPRYPLGATPG